MCDLLGLPDTRVRSGAPTSRSRSALGQSFRPLLLSVDHASAEVGSLIPAPSRGSTYS